MALQYELDAREIPTNFSTGYIPLGTFAPDQYPTSIYGTEVFEVNDALRQLAIGFTANVTLNDTTTAQMARALYANTSAFAPGANPAGPSVVACDTATSDVFWSGDLLGEAFENTTSLFTNGTGVYCTTQQEDNGTLEALLRASVFGRVDFSRIIIMRSAANFDRPYDGQSAADHLFAPESAFESSLINLYLAGIPVVQAIVDMWEETFEKGVEASNYVGDIYGSLGGQPDFGPGSVFGGDTAKARRALRRRMGLAAV